MKPEIKKRLFIVGCPRSGTTLLQTFIAAHPQVKSFPETHFIPHLISKWSRITKIPSSKGKYKLNNLLELLEFRGMPNRIPSFGSIRHYVDCFINILDTVTIENGKQIWLEKTPSNLHYIDIIEKYIPDAKFIHIIRNGEDVVASLYEVTHQYPEQWRGSRSIKKCVKRWNNDIKRTRKHLRKKNHICTAYESLVEKTENELKELCIFIGLEYDISMMARYDQKANELILGGEKWKSLNRDKIKRQNKRKFDSVFNPEEKKWIKQNLIKI
jgi:hypothetical protein